MSCHIDYKNNKLGIAYLEHWVNNWWPEVITHKGIYVTRSVYTKLPNFMKKKKFTESCEPQL